MANNAPTAPQNAFSLEISLTTAKVGDAPGVTYNILGILDYVKIYEDLKDDCIEGVLVLYDTNKISSLYPIIGRETLKIKFSNRDSDGNFIEPYYEKEFDIIGLESQTTSTFGDRSQLILKFISKPYLVNQRIKISKTYKGTNDKIVREILQKFFTETTPDLKRLYPITDDPTDDGAIESFIETNAKKLQNGFTRAVTNAFGKTAGKVSEFATNLFTLGLIPGKNSVYVEPTKFEYTYIVPNQTPFEFIHALTHNSISAANDSTNFAFWENRGGFNFKSLVSLGQEEPKITITNNLNSKLSGVVDRFAIINFAEVKPIDNMNRLGGILGSTSYTHIINEGRMEKKTYDYYKHFKDDTQLKMNPGNIFIDDTNEMFEDYRTVYGISDKTTNPDEGVYRDHLDSNFLLRKQMELRLLDNYTNEATLAGAIDIECGSVINVEFQDALQINKDSDKVQPGTPDIFKSGKYVINRLCHELNPLNFYTHIEIVKDSILVSNKKLRTGE